MPLGNIDVVGRLLRSTNVSLVSCWPDPRPVGKRYAVGGAQHATQTKASALEPWLEQRK